MIISIIRTSILYIITSLLLRIMGKRQIGELQPNELVITILISNMISMAVEKLNSPLLLCLAPVIVLVLFELIFSTISLKSHYFRKLISGKPIFVIEDGKINYRALCTLRLSIDDLLEGLRSCEVFNINDVAYAVFETTGKLNVVKKFNAQSVTPPMVNINCNKKTNIQLAVISDGKINMENLKYVGLTKSWVLNFLQKKNITLSKVFLLTADCEKNFYIHLKES